VGCAKQVPQSDPSYQIGTIEFRGEALLSKSLKGMDITIDGRIYVVDSDTDELIIVSPNGQVVARFGGSGWRAGEFSYPIDVSYNPLSTSQIYVLDSGNNRVQKGDLVTGRFGTVAPDTLNLNSPQGLDADTIGSIYIADTGNRKAIRFDASTGKATELLSGELAEPIDVSVGANTLYILDSRKLFRCDSLGNIISSINLPRQGEYTAVTTWGRKALVVDRKGRLILMDVNSISVFVDEKLKGAYDANFFRDSVYVTCEDGYVRRFSIR
jgi:DNA-binding beta-propeller fold protein YncE